MEVKIKKLRDGFELPKKSFDSDACFDVKVLYVEWTQRTAICYLGFATEIPIGWKGVIVPRSSITKTDWVMQNSPGQVDSHYRGEWQVRFKYIGNGYNDESPFKVGDRIAQIFFERVNDVFFFEVDELGSTERSDGGFGSTGRS
jgi:dUTP pyrophosphatase